MWYDIDCITYDTLWVVPWGLSDFGKRREDVRVISYEMFWRMIQYHLRSKPAVTKFVSAGVNKWCSNTRTCVRWRITRTYVWWRITCDVSEKSWPSDPACVRKWYLIDGLQGRLILPVLRTVVDIIIQATVPKKSMINQRSSRADSMYSTLASFGGYAETNNCVQSQRKGPSYWAASYQYLSTSNSSESHHTRE